MQGMTAVQWGAALRRIRKEHGLTQEEVGVAIQVYIGEEVHRGRAQLMVSRLERGYPVRGFGRPADMARALEHVFVGYKFPPPPADDPKAHGAGIITTGGVTGTRCPRCGCQL